MTYLRRKIQVLPVYEMLHQLLIGSKPDRAGNLRRKSDSTFLFCFFEARSRYRRAQFKTDEADLKQINLKGRRKPVNFR